MDHVKLRQKIESITDEVSELHPLLESVLPHIERVVKVDYTHGPNEKGADFIVTRSDDAFGGLEYAGVIAKKGSIKQNNYDVSRQVKECSWPRNGSDGKPIILSEIWVIATGNITSNARDALHEEYSDKKIKWVDSYLLSNWINQHVPSYWEDLPVKVGEYLSFVRNNNQKIENQLTLAPSIERSFYLPPSLEKIESDEYKQNKKKKRRELSAEMAIESRRFVVIEGQMGSGKSKLLRRITTWFAEPEVFAEKKVIPIIITYKNLIEDFDGKITRVVEKTLERNKISEDDCSKFLVAVDAFDEHKQTDAERSEQLESLAVELEHNESYQVVLASRKITDSTIKDRLTRKADRYEINPLTLAQVGKFIECVCETLNVKNRLLEDLKKSPLFKVLPRTPIAAIILGRLLEENIEDLPANMTELYTKYVELSLGRWDMTKGLQSQKEFEAQKNTTARIAEFMLDNELSVISIEESKQIGKDYLSHRNLGINYDDLFENLSNRSDLFFIDSEKGVLAFKHKTFEEYFYACRKYQNGYPEFDERAYNFYWINANFFYVGLRRDCPDLLRRLTELSPSENGDRIMRLLNLGNFFLAGYLSPYDSISDGIKQIAIDGADYFLEIADNPEHPLARFSYMQLLGVFRMLFTEGYSYPFFKEAIENALLTIDDEVTKTDRKVLALFFLELVNAELGSDQIFGKLLSKHDADLPLPVSLAIAHEADFHNVNSSPIRKMQKRVKKTLRGKSEQANQASGKRLQALYKTPLKISPIT